MANKKRHDVWLSLYPPKSIDTFNHTIALRKIAEINRLENLCILNMHARDEATALLLQDSADVVAHTVFGVSCKELMFVYPENYSDLPKCSYERISIDEQHDRHYEQYATYFLTDDETVDFFMRYKVDFRNERGQPLLCTKKISLAAEVAAKGIAGKLPDPEKVSEQEWERNLIADAERFKAAKGKPK